MTHYKIVALCLLSLGLGGCDLLQDSNPRPWIGYAFNENNKRFEFEFKRLDN